jgi:hypothetical protein
VLKHRYGDCKDKATLMIATLRALGITALGRNHPRRRGARHGQPRINFQSRHRRGAARRGRLSVPRSDFLDRRAVRDLPWQDHGVPVVVKDDGPPTWSRRRFALSVTRRRHTVTATVLPDGMPEGTTSSRRGDSAGSR